MELRAVELMYNKATEDDYDLVVCTHQVTNRIVSINQPWVSLIVLDKMMADVEFVAKIFVSVVDGYIRIEHLGWMRTIRERRFRKRLKETKNKQDSIQSAFLADNIYRIGDNLQYCDTIHIHISGPKL